MTQLALAIDLNACIGCGACVSSCQEWNALKNTNGNTAPNDQSLTEISFTQVQTYEIGEFHDCETLHFPKSCLHCKNPPCVPVCPTGASYKRKEDGIVLVDYDKCIGCKYCLWACPYGARDFDTGQKIVKKCTLCVDKIYDESLSLESRVPSCVSVCPTDARLFGDINEANSKISIAISEQEGYQLMPEWGADPSSRYLSKRKNGYQLVKYLFAKLGFKEKKI